MPREPSKGGVEILKKGPTLCEGVAGIQEKSQPGLSGIKLQSKQSNKFSNFRNCISENFLPCTSHEPSLATYFLYTCAPITWPTLCKSLTSYRSLAE